jgi:beta-lactamase regulating signal transducer with metallopeptidase domain
MLCILYVNGITGLLAIAALLIDRALPAAVQRRLVWFAAIGLATAIPPLYLAKHHSAVVDVIEHDAAAPSLVASASMAWMPASFPDLIGRIQVATPFVVRSSLFVSAAILLLVLANAVRVRLLVVRSNAARRNGTAPRVIDGVDVLVTDRLGPATVGVWRSKVLVPRWVLALPGEERRYVLQHEEEHRRSSDALLLFVASVPLILVAWNLPMWWLLRRLRLAVEMDCDNRVVNALGNVDAYSELLLKVGIAASRGPRLQPAFLGMAGTLEQRLRALVDPAPLRHLQRYLVPALACALVALALALPHPVYMHQPDAAQASSTHGAHAAKAPHISQAIIEKR